MNNKNNVTHFISGAIAGACDVAITMPLDVIKTNMQINPTKFKNPLYTFSSISKTSGISGLYRGMIPFLIQTSGKSAIRFSAFNYCKNSYIKLTGSEGMFTNLLAGLTAGVIESSIWTTPTERLKVLKQTNPNMTSISQIIKHHGFNGLFIGGVPTAMRQASSVGFRFMMYDKTKQIISRGNPDTTATRLLSGGIVGSLSVCLNNPIDVIKSIRQSGDTNTYLHSIRSVYRNHGISGFFSGLSARVPRIFIGQAVTFAVYENLYDLLSGNK